MIVINFTDRYIDNAINLTNEQVKLLENAYADDSGDLDVDTWIALYHLSTMLFFHRIAILDQLGCGSS